jgi:hypothetical protein
MRWVIDTIAVFAVVHYGKRLVTKSGLQALSMTDGQEMSTQGAAAVEGEVFAGS